VKRPATSRGAFGKGSGKGEKEGERKSFPVSHHSGRTFVRNVVHSRHDFLPQFHYLYRDQNRRPNGMRRFSHEKSKRFLRKGVRLQIDSPRSGRPVRLGMRGRSRHDPDQGSPSAIADRATAGQKSAAKNPVRGSNAVDISLPGLFRQGSIVQRRGFHGLQKHWRSRSCGNGGRRDRNPRGQLSRTDLTCPVGG